MIDLVCRVAASSDTLSIFKNQIGQNTSESCSCCLVNVSTSSSYYYYSQSITPCHCHSGISLRITGVRGYMCNCSVKLSLEKSPAASLTAWLSGSELTEGQSWNKESFF